MSTPAANSSPSRFRARHPSLLRKKSGASEKAEGAAESADANSENLSTTQPHQATASARSSLPTPPTGSLLASPTQPPRSASPPPASSQRMSLQHAPRSQSVPASRAAQRRATNAFAIHVRNADLRNATDNGLPKMSSRVLRRLRRKVLVESAAYSRSDSLFFAPLPGAASTSGPQTGRAAGAAPQPVTFAAVRPGAAADHLVSARHDFEVALVGLHVSPARDAPAGTAYEPVLYSVTRRFRAGEDGRDELGALFDSLSRSAGAERLSDESFATAGNEPRRAKPAAAHRAHSRVGATLAQRFGMHPHAPSASALGPDDEAVLHYDPLEDGHEVGASQDTFRAVPARKSLLYFHRGGSDARRATVPVRFAVMEVDCMLAAGRPISQSRLVGSRSRFPFGRTASQPHALADPALARLAAKPENVISKDFEFRLLRDGADGEAASESSEVDQQAGYDKSGKYADNYLRYGYYFFLGKKIDARLYAQTDTSSQAVPLLLRRMGRRAERGSLGERQFFPLTGVSYVVMRVSPGCAPERTERSELEKEADRERLEDILSMNHTVSMYGAQRH